MLQTAVFVDAGYLFAAGSALISGKHKPRTACRLNIDKAIEAITKFSNAVEPNARLLRIYWYDGIRPYNGPSTEQMALGKAHNVKLRLGMLNSQGQQKGVDSLIVTDLIDLARNKAISDALILAGDEDLRVGVQVAQTYGVRVHLLGVAPTRSNVSPHLMQEIDSLAELGDADVKAFLTCAAAVVAPAAPIAAAKPPLEQPKAPDDVAIDMQALVDSIFARFDADQISAFREYVATNRSLPREFDAPMLAQARDDCGRDLTVEEKRDARLCARQKLEGA